MSYNGWTNRETWCVSLWCDYDEQAQECVSEVILGNTCAEDIREEATNRLAECISDEINDMWNEHMSIKTGTLIADLIGDPVARINFEEIARSYIGDVDLYIANWNMPGYMPDSDPAFFTDASDAREYIAERMEDEGLEAEAASVREGKGELGVTVGKYHYFVTKA